MKEIPKWTIRAMFICSLTVFCLSGILLLFAVSGFIISATKIEILDMILLLILVGYAAFFTDYLWQNAKGVKKKIIEKNDLKPLSKSGYVFLFVISVFFLIITICGTIWVVSSAANVPV